MTGWKQKTWKQETSWKQNRRELHLNNSQQEKIIIKKLTLPHIFYLSAEMQESWAKDVKYQAQNVHAMILLACWRLFAPHRMLEHGSWRRDLAVIGKCGGWWFVFFTSHLRKKRKSLEPCCLLCSRKCDGRSAGENLLCLSTNMSDTDLKAVISLHRAVFWQPEWIRARAGFYSFTAKRAGDLCCVRPDSAARRCFQIKGSGSTSHPLPAHPAI